MATEGTVICLFLPTRFCNDNFQHVPTLFGRTITHLEMSLTLDCGSVIIVYGVLCRQCEWQLRRLPFSLWSSGIVELLFWSSRRLLALPSIYSGTMLFNTLWLNLYWPWMDVQVTRSCVGRYKLIAEKQFYLLCLLYFLLPFDQYGQQELINGLSNSVTYNYYHNK